jgi:hypothetical protein
MLADMTGAGRRSAACSCAVTRYVRSQTATGRQQRFTTFNRWLEAERTQTTTCKLCANHIIATSRDRRRGGADGKSANMSSKRSSRL